MREFRTREEVEEQIEILIALLDVIDGDPDLEPSLGLNGYLSNDPPDLEGDDCDLEPILGSAEGSFCQVNWGAGPLYDLEDQCEDEGAQCDDEGVQWAR